jgi:hypothetical protein
MSVDLDCQQLELTMSDLPQISATDKLTWGWEPRRVSQSMKGSADKYYDKAASQHDKKCHDKAARQHDNKHHDKAGSITITTRPQGSVTTKQHPMKIATSARARARTHQAGFQLQILPRLPRLLALTCLWSWRLWVHLPLLLDHHLDPPHLLGRQDPPRR